jgi:hypothetical protein
MANLQLQKIATSLLIKANQMILDDIRWNKTNNYFRIWCVHHIQLDLLYLTSWEEEERDNLSRKQQNMKLEWLKHPTL